MVFLLIIGAIIGLIGFIMILVAAFRTSALWGVGILAAGIAPSFFIKNIYVASAIGFVVVILFIVQHWSEARTAFIVYAVGTALMLPGIGDAMKQMEAIVAQQQAAQTTSHAAPAPEPQQRRPVERAAVVAPNEPILPVQKVDRTPKAESTERPMIEMKPVEQVYVVNATKKYYPADCKARPDGSYKMAKSLATSQGYTLAPECAK